MPKAGNSRKRQAAHHSSDESDNSAAENYNAADLAEVEQLIKQHRAAAEQEENSMADDKTEVETKTNNNPHKRSRTREYFNNTSGLLSKLNEISLPSEWPWLETLQITAAQPLILPDVHDDLARESQFYLQSLTAVQSAITQLKSQKIPYLRPADYFAEMIKPDKQMARIKDSLLLESKKMESVEQRKQQKEAKKFAKQVQTQKLQDKHKEKKQNMEQAKKFRGKPGQNNLNSGGGEEEMKSTLPGYSDLKKAQSKVQLDKRENHFNKKKARKDAKYGHGGKKKHVKSNTRDSTDDSSAFSNKRNKSNFSDFGAEKPGRRSHSNKGNAGGAGNRNKNGSSFVVKNKRPGKESRTRSNKF
jgi:rRNA-processing protein EBP2